MWLKYHIYPITSLLCIDICNGPWVYLRWSKLKIWSIRGPCTQNSHRLQSAQVCALIRACLWGSVHNNLNFLCVSYKRISQHLAGDSWGNIRYQTNCCEKKLWIIYFVLHFDGKVSDCHSLRDVKLSSVDRQIKH